MRFPFLLVAVLVGSMLASPTNAQTFTLSGPGLRAPAPIQFPLTAEQAEILGHMSIVFLDDGLGGTVKTIQISGANFRIVNGSGTTDGAADGLGNLIVGYNELRGGGDDRTGSHNLIVGMEHNYSSHGGLVAGRRSTISGAHASVSGGAYNRASGTYSSVSGGFYNVAGGYSSSVSGGRNNIASGYFSSVSGGDNGTAPGTNDWRAGTLFEDS